MTALVALLYHAGCLGVLAWLCKIAPEDDE